MQRSAQGDLWRGSDPVNSGKIINLTSVDLTSSLSSLNLASLHAQKDQLEVSMEALYAAGGLSRQAFHHWLRPSDEQQGRTPPAAVLQMAQTVRQKFLPGAGARQLYYYIRNEHEQYDSMLLGWGKHAFEGLCLQNGLRVESRRFVPKTTVRGHFIFPNLIEGRSITDINQVWVSDICYLYGQNGLLLGYATSLLDLYSRRLLGLCFSQTMHAACTSQEVLRQGLQVRKNPKFADLIFHSDGGKQYIETNFIATLRAKNIQSSMAESCYENAFAEAFNDILKNHMLYDLNLNSFPQLKKQEHFIKKCYNDNRPHGSIQRLTPSAFEKHLLTLQPDQRTVLKIKTIDVNNSPKTNFKSINLS